MKDILKGELVRLSAVDPEELGKAYAKWNRNTELTRLFDARATRMHSAKSIKEFFEKEIEEESPAHHFFTIRALNDNRLLGDINLDVIDWGARDSFVGIGIYNRADWGKGYGTDAMNIILRIAFTEINLRRVTLTVFEYNPRAIRCYEKVGFQHEGRMRGALLRDGKRWDILYMGILCDDWKENIMTKLQTKEPLLDSIPSASLRTGLSLRSVKWADAEAVAKLIYDLCEAEGDTTVAHTPEELKHEWESDGFNLETDAFLVDTKDGRVVGYEECVNVHAHSRLRFDGYVHPEFKGCGIGTALLRTLEVRAREELTKAEPDVRVFIHSTMGSNDLDGRKLHENEGYHPVRYHYRMEITLEGAPPAPIWPEGVELRPFIRERHEHAVWQAQNESFRDHWGSHNVSFEDFVHSRFDDPEYDPSLWAIAWDGDEVAGISINRFRMGIGWIRTLGVRRPWRKKGLGLALLQYSFGEFYRRGMKTIGLGVDASNPTGATRLYQRARMSVASEFVTYEKELRPGREL